VAVVLLLALSAVVWQFDWLRTERTSGLPRPTAQGIGGDSAKAPAPLDVTAAEAPPEKCTNGWIVPDSGNTPIPIPETEGHRPPDAVLGDGGQVKVTVQSQPGAAVTLTSVRVEIVAKHPAVKGIFLPSPCGPETTPHDFDLDLARREPQAVAQPRVAFPYPVTDAETFVFTAGSPDEDVEWRLHLSWTSGAQSGEVAVDNNGKPFRTTATVAARPFCPTPGTWIPPRADAPCGMPVVGASEALAGKWTRLSGTLTIGTLGDVQMKYKDTRGASRELTLSATSVTRDSVSATVMTSNDSAAPVGSTFVFRKADVGMSAANPDGTATSWCDQPHSKQDVCTTP
jgi:hypothetical protein